MQPRKFAIIGGLIMLLMGIFAMIPSLYQTYSANLPPINFDQGYGLFVGFLPMNIVNKVALILFGLAGISAANAPTTNLPKSIYWARAVCVVMGILAVLGAIPATNTLYGFWPLFGNEVLVHAFFAILGGYFGFALTSKAKEEIKPLLQN